VIEELGLSAELSEDLLLLTVSLVRGLGVRHLWAPDPAQVQRLLRAAARTLIGQIDLTRSMAAVLQALTHEGRHQALLDDLLERLAQLLRAEDTRAFIAASLGQWLKREHPLKEKVLPSEWLSDKGANAIAHAVESLLAEIARNPEHQLRDALDEALARLITRLQSDPEWERKGEEIRRYLQTDPTVGAYAESLWAGLRARLQRELADEQSALVRRIVGMGQWLGRALAGDALLRERLDALAIALEALFAQPIASRAYVDTGPLLERPLAAAAGLGWIGKNTLLLHPALGSYLFLGALLLDLPLPPDLPQPERCGSCRACLDACPTGALVEPGVLDARLCLSYTTIELRDAIPEPLRAVQGTHVFGCDVCQAVCPWNTRERREVPPDTSGLRARLAPRQAWREPSLAWLLGLDEDAWRAATRRTALRRTKHRFLLRNALVAAGNAADASLVPLVARHAASDDPLVAEHARWALARLRASAED
jgi:epoxyqueuosine reductase